jgi:AbrB family looped-hinge helix DNA binding protein
MTVAIDAAGRLVIPKEIREAVGLEPGQPLDIRARDGRIEIEPRPIDMALVDQGYGLVAVPAQPQPVPVLTTEAVRDVLERLRR